MRAAIRMWALAMAFGLVGLTAAPSQAAYSGQPLSGWVPNNTVYASAVSGETVYIGGRFTNLRDPATGQTVARDRLAAFDASTGALLPWNPQADDTVRALALSGDGGTVFVGGEFDHINRADRPNLTAVDAIVGELVDDWQGTSTGSVRSMVVDGSRLYVAGTFSRMNGIRQFGLAALVASDGALVDDWVPKITGGRPRTITLSPDGQSLLVGGFFTEIDGAPREFLGSVSTASGDVTGWAPQSPCSDCYVFDLDAAGPSVFAAVGGAGGGRAVAYDAVSAAQAWLVRGDGNVQAIATDGELVYAGGHFGPGFGGESRNQPRGCRCHHRCPRRQLRT